MLIRLPRRKSRKLLIKRIIVSTSVTLFVILECKDLIVPVVITKENVNDTCFFNKGGVLRYLDEEFSPQEDSIYFHETSCRGGLNSRQACSVESAANAHPEMQIYVFFLSPVRDLNNPSLKVLSKIKNVHLNRIDLLKYSQGTPLESLLVRGSWRKSNYKISHASDFLRYMTLYKWGGIYLDLDALVVKNLKVLGSNWAARENNYFVAAGAMAFSRDMVGRLIAETTAQNIANDYRGDVWGHNGPGVITRALQEVCHTTNIHNMNTHSCNGFSVYEPEIVYPVQSTEAKKYFMPAHNQYSKTYIHHVWNKLTSHLPIPEDSFYAYLAKKHCPKVYYAYNGSFGV